MKIAILHKHYDDEHLASVKEEMRVMGRPKIKAVWMPCYDMWAALEGCHRIRAAYALGLVPEIEEIEYDDNVTVGSIGVEMKDTTITVAEAVDGCELCPIFEFAE